MGILAGTVVDWMTGIGLLLVVVGTVGGAVTIWRRGRRRVLWIGLVALLSPMAGFLVGGLVAGPCHDPFLGGALCILPEEEVIGLRIGIAIGLALGALMWMKGRHAQGDRVE